MSCSQPIGGYDLNLFLDKEEACKYLCTICQGVAKEAVEAHCDSGHIFCNACLISYGKKECPNDRTLIKSSNYSGFVNSQIVNLEIKCPSHLQASQIENIDASWKEIEMMKSECDWQGSLKEGDIHYPNKCNYRLVQCPRCHHVMCLDAFKDHRNNKCAFSIIDCPNHVIGCIVKCERQLMDQHLKHCIFTKYDCPFTQYGCDYTNINGKQLESVLKQHCNDLETKINHLEMKIRFLENNNNNNKHKNNNIGNNNDSKKDARNEFGEMKEAREGKEDEKMRKGNLGNNSKCLFAWIGSTKGKYNNQHSIECIDIKNSVCFSLIDNNTNNNMSNHCIFDCRNCGFAVGYNVTMQNKISRNKFDVIKNETCLFRVGGWNANDLENEKPIRNVNAYCIESKQWINSLPNLPFGIKYCNLVFSNYHGLIVIGGATNEQGWQTQSLISRNNSIVSKFCQNKEQMFVKLKDSGDCNEWHKIENNDDNSLDSSNKKEMIDGNSLVLNTIYQLQLDCQSQSHNDLHWKQITSMKEPRMNGGVCKLYVCNNDNSIAKCGDNECLFVCGGYPKNRSKTCELYNFKSKQWTSLASMKFEHQSPGVCYFGKHGNEMCKDDSIIVIGGYPYATSFEEYSILNNKWYQRPCTNYEHCFSPALWIDRNVFYSNTQYSNNNGNGILICAGNRINISNLNDDKKLGKCEFYDFRDKKWYKLASVKNLLSWNFHNICKNNESFNTKKRLRSLLC